MYAPRHSAAARSATCALRLGKKSISPKVHGTTAAHGAGADRQSALAPKPTAREERAQREHAA